MVDSAPGLKEIDLEPVYMLPVDLVEIAAESLRDQTGNDLRDQGGKVIYD